MVLGLVSLSCAVLMAAPSVQLPMRVAAGPIFGGCLLAMVWGRR
jgi:hypothetical protein